MKLKDFLDMTAEMDKDLPLIFTSSHSADVPINEVLETDQHPLTLTSGIGCILLSDENLDKFIS